VQTIVSVTGYANLVAFVALAALALWEWHRRRAPGAGWLALAFSTLGIVLSIGRLLPKHPHGFAESATVRVLIVLLVLFPVLLAGFTTAFDQASPLLRRFVATMTTALVVWTLALPRFPQQGQSRPWWFVAFVVAFVFHWSVLTIVVAYRLWRAGRGQPGVARRRMQWLAIACVLITVAIVVSASTTRSNSPGAAVSGILAFITAIAFVLGFAPPALLRASWRRPEQRRAQEAIQELVTIALEPAEIVARVLRPMIEIVGARAILLRDQDGEVVGSFDAPEPGVEWPGVRIVEVQTETLRITVWTSPYAPFFGADELQILTTLGALTGIALERVKSYAREHEARLVLERANEVQAAFVALAAHELRTPVTTIHGFVRTLNHYADRLSEERELEMRRTLEEQTTRMARLVEQLLDLSRLEADAVEIRPQAFDVRSRVDQLVALAAGGRAADVVVEVSNGVEATADLDAFERIISNLVTNALRYGRPPVTVHVERTDRHLRVAVEDRGQGVPADFVPDLFERFSRAGVAQDRTPGTGLGLAIARSYARAHGGDLLYEDAEPHGARFLLVLPTDVQPTSD
jgi:signal transduction histidine kinase